MTDILCSWLNNEVKLSRHVDPANFAREFATGYLIGEALNKYQLQNDFDQFSQTKTADSKLNNFTRLEPVLHILEIPFDTNIARDVMTEKHGIATKIMYQMFIALNKKEKNKLTGVAMETMRPAGPVKLEAVESIMYKERLKHLTPRQTDLNLDALVARFHEKQIAMERTAFKDRFEEEERQMQDLQDKRAELMRKHKESQDRKADMLTKINNPGSRMANPGTAGKRTVQSSSARDRAAGVHIPKPPANRTAKVMAMRNQQRKLQEAQNAMKDIETFEEKLLRTLPPSQSMGDSDDSRNVSKQMDSVDFLRESNNDEYIGKIRKRLNEDASARAEREKRRRKVLVDQLKAHEAQEEARREEMLVNRLMRQSQQERRIAVQLLQARHEKEIIRRNRLMREKQYEERKLKEFEDALNREAEMARLAKEEYLEQTKADQELHAKIAAERAETRYRKHYNFCGEVLHDMMDLSCKTAEYRELTNKLLPAKLMRDWKELFVNGLPLYEGGTDTTEPEEPTPGEIVEQERQALLNEADFTEYRNMTGEWQPPEGSELAGPPKNNPILGHIIQRLFNIVHPPSPPPPPPAFPEFPIKACVLGRVFAGKTSCVQKLAENHRLQVLSPDNLVTAAVEAFKDGEVLEREEEEEEEIAISAPPTAIAGERAVGDSEPVEATPDTGASAEPPDNKLQEEGTPMPSPQHEPTEDDGMEKSDPEKPVVEENDSGGLMVKTPSQISVHSKRSARSKGSSKPESSPRAKLGSKVMKFLKKGKPVDDALVVEIITEAIQRVPEGTGWVLDGYPTTYGQAKLLEKALSGFDATSRESSKANLKEPKAKSKKSVLSPDPKPAPPPPEPSSGINVVIVLEVDDDVCLKRSAGRTYASQTEEQYQQEFKPPPEGSATGLGKQEKVLPIEDVAHDQEQIQHRLTTFQESWTKLEKWFSKFGSLRRVDASQSETTVYLEVENIMEQTLNKVLGKDIEESLILDTTATENQEQPPQEAQPAVEPEAVPAKVTEDKESSKPGSKKGSRSGSAKRSGSRSSSAKEKDKRDKSKSPGRTASKAGSGKKSAKGSRGSSPKSPGRSRSRGKANKTPEPEPELEPEEPPGTPPPQPGSEAWEYVDQPVDEELAKVLAPYWETIEATYIDDAKEVFKNVRDERENIIRYLYSIRKDFLAYLQRPDHKQEFVTQWQKEYNAVSPDLRDDDETRCELHQRVDDLRERLWSICDERKEQAEEERGRAMTEGWLEDHTGLLCNHYITLMQAEVDRFQDTLRMLRDYYRGMEGQIPDELNQDYARLPLVELPIEEPEPEPETDRQSLASDSKSQVGVPATGTVTPPGEDGRTSPVKSRSSSAHKRKPTNEQTSGETMPPEASATEVENERTPRIPLVPRRPASPDQAQGGAGKGGKGDKSKKAGGKGEPASESPQPPADLDDKLIFDAHVASVANIDKMIATEQAAREAEEAAEREAELEKEREKERLATEAAKKKGGGKKKAKSRSPSPKKGKEKDTPSTTTPPPTEEESEEEMEKKKIKERSRQEFFAAVVEEANAAKIRLELAKTVAMGVLADLKLKADEAYKDMNDWLGARFLKEMESIDHMSEVMRNAVESSSLMVEEVALEQDNFLLNEDMKVLKSPSPVLRPAPVESVQPDSFTVTQIMNLYSQFSLTAPSGVISIRAFQDVFLNLAALTYGTEQLPDMWTGLTLDKLEALGLKVSSDGEYIDWRSFSLAAAQPWPMPTQSQLLDTLQNFQAMDQKATGYITREQYELMNLWFSGSSLAPTPDDTREPSAFDRLTNLKEVFFDIFADHNMEPASLDYVSMLMYFSAVADPYEGFLRALSVAAGTHMPHLPRKTAVKKASRPPSQASVAVSVDLEADKSTEEPSIPDDVPEDAVHALVPLEALYRVLHHAKSMRGDSHRFSVTADPEDAFSKERLLGVYQELGSEDVHALPYSVLAEHPVIQDMLTQTNQFKTVDLKHFLTTQVGDGGLDSHSVKTSE